MSEDSSLETERLTQFLKLWHCERDGEPFMTHGSLLCPVKRTNEPLMMKVVLEESDEHHSGDMISYYNGYGCVRLLEDHKSAQLLERIVSPEGHHTLESMVIKGEDEEATSILCAVIEKLHASLQKGRTPTALTPFRERDFLMRQHLAEGRVADSNRPLFERALFFSHNYFENGIDSSIPLHGDIHHGNVLFSDSRGWLAIDPKGILGPRAYEYAGILCNPHNQIKIVTSKARLHQQAIVISQRTGIEKQELLQYAYLHACQCAAWSLYEPDKSTWLACVKNTLTLLEETDSA